MRAEIGFIRDWGLDGALTDRLRLTVQSQSTSEATTLLMFARRMGLEFDESSGQLTIDEPAKPASAPAWCGAQEHGADCVAPCPAAPQEV